GADLEPGFTAWCAPGTAGNRERRPRAPERPASPGAEPPDPVAQPPDRQRAPAAYPLPGFAGGSGAQSEDAAGGTADRGGESARPAGRAGAGAHSARSDRAHEPADRLPVAARQSAPQRAGPAQCRPAAVGRQTG